MTSSIHDAVAAQLLFALAPKSFIDMVAAIILAIVSISYLWVKTVSDRPNPLAHKWYERPQAANGALKSTNSLTRNIATRLEELDKDVVVFWGSQSGTAENLAMRLARDLSQRFALQAIAADLSDFDSSSITMIGSSKFVVFLLSTYGEGDPSDNASQFWEWVTANKQASSASNLRYAAFGLGNSNYEYYNRVVDVVDQHLHGAGAQRLAAVGRADDAEGRTEEHFCDWKEMFFQYLSSQLGIKQKALDYVPSFNAVHDTSLEPIDLHLGEPSHRGASAASCTPVKMIRIKHAKELYNEDSRSCLHLDLDLSEHGEVVYKTGDHLAVWPSNPDTEVLRLIRMLGLNGQEDVALSITAVDESIRVQVPSPTTAAALFRHYLEICSPVSFEVATTLARYCDSKKDNSWLSSICASREAYETFQRSNYLNLPLLLEIAGHDGGPVAWQRLPLSLLLEVLPKMRPRYYSISSSSVASPRILSITVSVSNTALEDTRNTIPGLASSYLLANANSLHNVRIPSSHRTDLYDLARAIEFPQPGKLFVHVRHSSFKLPVSAMCPVVMLAAGTGIAPFRAFIEERACLNAMGRGIGPLMLIFGCRSPDHDYLYREELKELKNTLGERLEIVVAFSRAPGIPKAYIQDKLKEYSSTVLGHLDNDASVYVCGRANMAREVAKEMSHVLMDCKGLTKLESQDWVKSMKRTKKWQEDVWG